MDKSEFATRLLNGIAACTWQPHPDYSVFTQYDFTYYTRRRHEFVRKYQIFYSIAQLIEPASIVELGTHAGSSADAYLSGYPVARYVGYDIFDELATGQDTRAPWKPFEVASALLSERGFDFELRKVNLRHLDRIPEHYVLAVVDAAHDFQNEYADLNLALTADPNFIWVDDYNDPGQAQPAINRFIQELGDRCEWSLYVDYPNGGMLIKLSKQQQIIGS